MPRPTRHAALGERRGGATTRHTDSAVARVCGIALPEWPALRQEFLVRLLPDVDAAWDEAARGPALDEAAYASLRALRKSAEQTAERCLFPGRESGRQVGFCAHAVLIETDRLVPESQVECALAWAVEAMRGALPPVSGTCAACAPAYFRYQDLMAVPLATVRAALVSAACDGNPAAALRRLPFRARPAAARCASIYLRFVVGVALANGAARDDGPRWSALEDLATAMLVSRLRMPVQVTAACGPRLYRPAHDGLRAYQMVRLDHIVALCKAGEGVAALMDLRDADRQGRVRLTLTDERASLAACMLQMPLDEGPTEMLERIAGRLHDRGITDVRSLSATGGGDAACAPILAVPG